MVFEGGRELRALAFPCVPNTSFLTLTSLHRSRMPAEWPPCPADRCLKQVRAPGHSLCPLHSPCFDKGVYVPERCNTCRDNIEKLQSATGHLENLPEHMVLETTLKHLLRALRKDNLETLTIMDPRLMDWFPHIITLVNAGGNGGGERLPSPVSQSASATETPRPSPSGSRQRSPSPRRPASPDGLGARLSRLEQSIQGLLGIQETLNYLAEMFAQSRQPSDSRPPSQTSSSSRKRRRSSDLDWIASPRRSSRSPSPKVPRHGPPAHSSYAPPSDHRPRADRSPARSDDNDASSDEDRNPSAPPSSSAGWTKCPLDWIYRQDAGGLIAMRPPKKKGPFEDVPNVEITSFSHDTGTDHFFRPIVLKSSTKRSPRTQARLLSHSLASLASRVSDASGPVPTVLRCPKAQ